ncbi:MAG: hypothetical protein EPN25_03190 [Nitrospirae bacterium]|nr:MAG: hypothetical protein EPN25_03190 [Nitrospirota bacterium]
MDILNKLERKLGRFAVRELMVYIIGINALIYFLRFGMPQSEAISKLMLDPRLILQGEVWRLISWVFIPPSASLFWIFFIFYFYYMVGTGLEREWGSFRFNIFYLTGVLGTALAAFITGEGTTALYLNLSLFLAFAYIYPDYEILLFFILPVKMKYLAWINWAFIAFTVLTAPLPNKVAAVVSISNYFLFFGGDILATIRRRGSSYNRRRAFAPARKATIHSCTICSRTEADDITLEFRYCSFCEGDHEYCMDHLKTHEHIKAGEEKP